MRKLTPAEQKQYDDALAVQRRLGLYVIQRRLASGWWNTASKRIMGHDEAYEELARRKQRTPTAEWCVVALPVAQAREECYNLHRYGFYPEKSDGHRLRDPGPEEQETS